MWGEFDSRGSSTASQTRTLPRGWRRPFGWSLERTLWAALVVTFAADVVTTYHGLQVGLAEGNPVVSYALATAGFGGFLATKLGTVGVAVAARSVVPDGRRPFVPLAFALVWGVAAAANLWLLV